MVEAAPGFGLDARLRQVGPESSPAANSVKLSEVYRYFSQSRFSFNWPTPYVRIRARILRLTLLSFYARILKRLLGRDRGAYVKNESSLIDFVPPNGDHLRNLDGFILRKRFYWSSVHRAVTDQAPMTVDASGYDLAVVDTPHFIKLTGIGPERVMTVVHDLIPLRDPSMDTNWRFLFIKKLRAALATNGNLIFVSEYTQGIFHQSFPDYRPRREFILYPAIRISLAARTHVSDVKSTDSSALPFPGSERPYAPEAEEPSKEKKPRKKQKRGPPRRWDPSLPYFATAVSDEARKNIDILVKAFGSLRNRVNIAIIGQINAARYLGPEDQRAANVLFTGYLSESEKIRVLQGATGVVFPSFAEGFGIPLVEGAVMGLPVLCSDIPVFREVAGENAIYFNPYEPASLIAAVETTLADPAAAMRKAESMRISVLKRFSQEAMSRRLAAALAELGL